MAAAVGLIVLGLICLVWALASSSSQVDRANQETSGLGASDLMQLLPGGAARAVFALISLGMIALGVVVLVG
jgi:hypothetical protein